MKNTIATVSVMSRKLKRRAEQVAIGREKQSNKAQAARAREQAYDQTIAAVQSRTSGSTASASPEPQMQSSSVAGAAGAAGGALINQAFSPLSPQSRSTISMPSIRLPFPLPAKPAFPIVSTTRSSSGTESPPPSSSQRLSPMLSGRGVETSTVTTGELGPEQAIEQADSNSNSPQQPLVDRFPQITSTTDDSIKAVGSSMEVEVVRLRRKKKAGSKSSASSVASTGTTGSKKGQAGKSAKAGPGTPRASSPSQI